MENIHKYQYTECDQDITLYYVSRQYLKANVQRLTFQNQVYAGNWKMGFVSTWNRVTYVLNIESQEIL